MKLGTLERHWNALGEEDPLWAILSSPDKRGGAWDLQEFLATGQAELDDLLAELGKRGIELQRRQALDFGCGIGRLTQALADHFERCDGVDVAASMIEGAMRLNQRGERCRFHLNRAPDLRVFPDRSFDFVLSLLVLQHMEPDLMKGYLQEFVRVLRPDGIAYFNIPEGFLLGTDLPPAASLASIECTANHPELAPREVVELNLVVRNQSNLSWPASARLIVGNHWLSPEGAMLVHDDARAAIEAAVAAGSHHEVDLLVAAPDKPGKYVLEVDLLQEHKGWFADLGSPTLRLPVTVAAAGCAPERSGSADPPACGDSLLAPRIEMHVMSREATATVIEEAGGVVLDVIARDRCGPLVPSFDYVIGRSSLPAKPRGLLRRRPRVARSAPQAPATRPLPSERLSRARAMIDDRADLLTFRLSSERRFLGPPSVFVRGLLRRAMLEVLHRQTEFNRASSGRIRELETQVDRLRASEEAQKELLVAADERIRALEAARDVRDPST